MPGFQQTLARPRRRRKLAAGIAVSLVALAVAPLGIVGWIGSERAIHPRQAHYNWSIADYPDLDAQSVGFESRTHTRIAALFFSGSRPATIILSHGYGDNQAQMLPWAAFLHRAGFSVLSYDMRSRGRSAGDAVTLGALEPLDLISAVDYLTTRGDVDRERIGALGLSLGAATTLLAAAGDRRIRAVVDDSGFSSAPEVIRSAFEHFIGLPAFPFAPITVAIADWRAGVEVRKVRPVDAMARISPRPVFIIHCLEDRVVPPENSQRNFRAAREPKQIWWIPRGGHVAGRSVATEEYERRVIDFFDRALADGRGGPSH